MNKFKEHLEISMEVQTKLLEYLMKNGIVKKQSDYYTISDILFSYHNFPEGFSWDKMRSYLIIDKYKKECTLGDAAAKQWVNRKISKMIELGYAIKTHDPNDKRKIYIKWTKEIEILYNNVSRLFEK